MLKKIYFSKENIKTIKKKIGLYYRVYYITIGVHIILCVLFCLLYPKNNNTYIETKIDTNNINIDDERVSNNNISKGGDTNENNISKGGDTNENNISKGGDTNENNISKGGNAYENNIGKEANRYDNNISKERYRSDNDLSKKGYTNENIVSKKRDTNVKKNYKTIITLTADDFKEGTTNKKAYESLKEYDYPFKQFYYNGITIGEKDKRIYLTREIYNQLEQKVKSIYIIRNNENEYEVIFK